MVAVGSDLRPLFEEPRLGQQVEFAVGGGKRDLTPLGDLVRGGGFFDRSDDGSEGG